MNQYTLYFVLIAASLVACGVPTDSPDSNAATTEDSVLSTGPSGQLTIDSLPDPCVWLSTAEAQDLLGLDEPPPQMPMGSAHTAGRSCVYTNAKRTTWINVSYDGLNPQIFSAQGKSEQELIDLANTKYAHGLEHVYSGNTDGFPTLGFQDTDRSILVVFTDIGISRDLPEGISSRFSVSTYNNVLLYMSAPDQTGQARLAALKGLVDRPVAQLKRQRAGN